MIAITSAQVIAAAAVVQGLTAVLIFLLTRGLVRATRQYVSETQRLAEATNAYVEESRKLAIEAKRTNDMAERNTERLLRRQGATLQVYEGGREGPHETSGDEWEFAYVVENVGAGIAHSVVLSFAEGEATSERTLGPGDQAVWTLFLPADRFPTVPPWPDHPELESLTFQDPDGTWWVQTVHRGHLRLPKLLEEP